MWSFVWWHFFELCIGELKRFFNRCIIGSPNYLNENEKLISQIEPQFDQNETQIDNALKVYFSWEERSFPEFENQLTKLCKNLENKKYQNLD